ncbi:MAG: ABC transporter ATP-binding protein, partial [Acidimicrobiales bacterium]
FVAGRDVTGKRAYQVSRAGVARTFQNIRLLGDETVYDNVLLASEAHHHAGRSGWDRYRRTGRVGNVSRERATACLDMVGLHERGQDRAGELPYGGQRMVEIARALAADPTVLFLDEPTSGLSGPEIERVALLVDQLKETGVAVVIVEHNMPFVMERADRISVLNFGELLAEGSPAEISRNQDVITAYLGEPEPADDEWGALA